MAVTKATLAEEVRGLEWSLSHELCLSVCCSLSIMSSSYPPFPPRPHYTFQVVPKEKHVRTLKVACSVVAPRPQVDFVIYKLGKRLSNPSWVIALKALMVFHRLMRECDPSFQEQVRPAHVGSAVACWSHESMTDCLSCVARKRVVQEANAAHIAATSSWQSAPGALKGVLTCPIPLLLSIHTIFYTHSCCASVPAPAATACCAWTATPTTPALRRGTTRHGCARTASSWTSGWTPSGGRASCLGVVQRP